MHPYTARILGLLGDRDPLEVLSATPDRLARLREGLGKAGLTRSYAPGKWTAREILAHFADVEIAVGFRVRQALAEDGYRIQPFDQDAWAKRYRGLDPGLAVEAFRGLRLWNLALFRSLSPEDLARGAFHPERGEEPVGTIVKLLAGHDLNHAGQLERILPKGSAGVSAGIAS